MPYHKQSEKQTPWRRSADVWKPTCPLNDFASCILFFNSYDFITPPLPPPPPPHPTPAAHWAFRLMEWYTIKVDIIIISLLLKGLLIVTLDVNLMVRYLHYDGAGNLRYWKKLLLDGSGCQCNSKIFEGFIQNSPVFLACGPNTAASLYAFS